MALTSINLPPAHFFAVDDHGVGGGNRAEHFLLPFKDEAFNLAARHRLQHALEDRLAGNVRLCRVGMNPAAECPALEFGQSLGEAAHGAVTLPHTRKASQGDNRQHRRQFMAFADGLTPLGHLLKTLPKTGHLLGFQSANRRR